MPLSLLRAAVGSAVLIEVKSGDTYNGTLTLVDTYMNVIISDVIHTTRDGERFTSIASAYVKGAAIKYLRLSDELLDRVKEEHEKQNAARGGGGNYRGGTRGRGGGGYRGRGAQVAADTTSGGGGRGGGGGGGNRGGSGSGYRGTGRGGVADDQRGGYRGRGGVDGGGGGRVLWRASNRGGRGGHS